MCSLFPKHPSEISHMGFPTFSWMEEMDEACALGIAVNLILTQFQFVSLTLLKLQRPLGTALRGRLPQHPWLYLSRSVHKSNNDFALKRCCVGKLRATSWAGMLLSLRLVLQRAWAKSRVYSDPKWHFSKAYTEVNQALPSMAKGDQKLFLVPVSRHYRICRTEHLIIIILVHQ